jgi:ABC-2 type transport system ATP-binding protein
VVLQGKVDEVRNRFRTSTYRVRILDGLFQPQADDLFTILETKEKGGATELRLQAAGGVKAGNLIRLLADRCDLVAFEEELPGMEDVFIRVVNPDNLKMNE